MRFTHEYCYVYVLRLVVFMLLIPLDTSEAERIFSLMNDIKTSQRTQLGQHAQLERDDDLELLRPRARTLASTCA